MEGVFLKKGEYADKVRKKYRIENGRIRVESLEVHVTEHCNLRCRGCDAMSPYNYTFFLSVDEADRVIAFMARHVVADVFKLMGGEPTLHPRLLEIMKAVKASGITRVLRLTTNGLLLHRMPDEFWELLDRLTVSNYSSGAMKAENVALVERKAREHGVLLNLKWVDQFNRVFLTSPIEEPKVVRKNYADCWIRHRSLVVRKGCFFKCTRAAYMDDFRAKLSLPAHEGDEVSYTAADGVPLAADGFRERLLDYLNSPDPLASCRYCLGASGELLPHRQLTREEIRRGVV
jgi:organic radical activating enzyme